MLLRVVGQDECDEAELVTALRTGNALLFVGAGVSMNLGIPSWSELTARPSSGA